MCYMVHFSSPHQEPIPIVVTVTFRDLIHNDPLKYFSLENGYAYLWPFETPPQVGDWAIAPGNDGPATVIVGALGSRPLPDNLRLVTLSSIVPTDVVAKARKAHDLEIERYLDRAKALVGISAPHDDIHGDFPPAGFDPLPPAAHAGITTDIDQGRLYGEIWWRVAMVARERGRPPTEVEAFKEAARSWYRLAERALANDREQKIAAVLSSLPDAIRGVRSRSIDEIEGNLLLGLHLSVWLNHVRALEKNQCLNEALELTLALIDVAEQGASHTLGPVPAPTERAAIIYRKQRDFAAEIAVLERWIAATEPSRARDKMAARLARAQELEAKG